MNEPDRDKLLQLEKEIENLGTRVYQLEAEFSQLKTEKNATNFFSTEADRAGKQQSSSGQNNNYGNYTEHKQEPFNLFQMLFSNNPLSQAVGGLGNGVQEMVNSFLGNKDIMDTLETGCTACRQAESKAHEFANSFGNLANSLETALLMMKTIRSFTSGDFTGQDSAQLISLISTLLPLFMNSPNFRGQTDPNTQSAPQQNSPPRAEDDLTPFIEDD